MSAEPRTQLLPIVPDTTSGRRRSARRGPAGAAGRQVSVAHHPRIAARVRTAKGWGALAAFVLVALASSKAGAESFDVLLRALAAGVVGFVVTWAAAVGIARSLVRAEVEAHRRALDEPADEAA